MKEYIEVEGGSCNDCAFQNDPSECLDHVCGKHARDDGKNVHYVLKQQIKSVRLTEEEVTQALNLYPQPNALVMKIVRTIEKAVLAKNGIEVE